MAEYIDREKALEEFEEWVECTGYLPKGTSYYYECRGCIEDVPAANVIEIKHGKWIKVAAYNNGVLNTVKCSECGTYQPIEKYWDYHAYCPYCGAKMDGDSNV